MTMTRTTTAIEPTPIEKRPGPPCALLLLTSLLVAVSCGCRHTASPPKTAAATTENVRLVAKSRQPDGRFAEIGVFSFGPDGRVDLTVTSSGTQADRLRAAWAEVSTRPALQTKTHDANGNLVGSTVPRGSPDYPTALADVMSREFGFFLTPSQGTR